MLIVSNKWTVTASPMTFQGLPQGLSQGHRDSTPRGSNIYEPECLGSTFYLLDVAPSNSVSHALSSPPVPLV